VDRDTMRWRTNIRLGCLVCEEKKHAESWRVTTRLKKPAGGIGPVRISKPPILLFTISKFQKKDKSQQKICKKLDQILRLLVKNFL
jgi:hypothetical protein